MADGRLASPSSRPILATTVFGSQLVDKNSSTPYTDATQVFILHLAKIESEYGVCVCLFC